MYAIFENGSKQYKASVGETVKLEKLDAEVGDTVVFPAVMTADDNGAVHAGKEVEKTSVAAEVVAIGKDKKIIVFKYKAKKNERKKQGHRQPFTTVKVTAIGENLSAKKSDGKMAEAKKPAPAKKAEVKAETAAEVKPATKKAATATKTTTAAKTSTATKSAATKTATAAKKPATTAKKTTAAKKPAAEN